jgi:hypothetical protein
VSDGCLIYTGALNSGYAWISVAGKPMRGHRLAYELFYGPIPDGCVIDHLCMNKACISPTHVEAVPQSVNVRRAIAAGVGPGATNRAKESCPSGHPYSGWNLIQDKQGRRHCRACSYARNRARRQKGTS